MNTEEAATRMAEAGNEHNIKESLRIGVSQTERTRAMELQRSMQSSMRSSKYKNKNGRN